MNRETFGAIDIGSNAIRLLIDYVEAYEDGRTEYKKAAFVRVPIRLGDDVFLRGRISNGKAEALCDAMQGFRRSSAPSRSRTTAPTPRAPCARPKTAARLSR